jgi:hypothetical protein
MFGRKPVRVTLGSLELFVGIGALAGGGALALVPDGDLLRMPVSLLNGSPFHTYFVPGLILFGIVGGVNTLAGFLTLGGHPVRKHASVFAAVILMGWISVEVALLGYLHWAQPLYFGFGLLTLLLAFLS